MAPMASVLGDVYLGIDHIGVAYGDLDDGVALWQSMGLRPTHREVNDAQGVAEAMLAIPATTLSVQVLAPLTPDSPVGRFIATHGQGLQQIALRVSDIDEACRRVAAHGVRLVFPAPQAGTLGSRINFIHPKDAGGVLVELVEHAGH